VTNDRQKALDELQKELLEDDLLQDLPPMLFDNSPEQDLDLDWEELLSQPETETTPAFEDPAPIPSSNASREDKWQTILMAVACFLCLGIIGVLIYWLEVFLK
jgi:hypothetical protein